MAIEREYQVRDYLIKKVKEIGGEARKIRYENRKGCADWMVLFGDIYLVELKGTKGKLSVSQARDIERLRKIDVPVQVINSKAGIDRFIKDVTWHYWFMREA